MLLKIQAIIGFVENGGKKTVITSPENGGRAVRGKTGTWIVPELSCSPSISRTCYRCPERVWVNLILPVILIYPHTREGERAGGNRFNLHIHDWHPD